MKTAKSYALVLVAAPDVKTARRLAQAALASRQAACVNIVRNLESHYWWRGRLEAGPEVLLLFKTATARLGALEKTILAGHPYSTPEFLVVPLVAGNKSYLDWLAGSLTSPKRVPAGRP